MLSYILGRFAYDPNSLGYIILTFVIIELPPGDCDKLCRVPQRAGMQISQDLLDALRGAASICVSPALY